MIRKSLTAAALCFLLASNIWSQSANATVSGIITDVTGGLMQGVTVTATNTQTGIVTVVLSNKSGTYNFAALQPGVYELSASQTGFETQNLKDLPFGSAQYEFKFTLPVATVTNTVEVSAPTDALMAASSSSVGDVLTEFMIRRLPLVGNDALSLVRMLPGVAVENDQLGMMSMDSTLNFAGVGQISLNTTRDGIPVSDGLLNNGADAATRLNPDMVGEIRLVLTPVDAEFGRGNSQVQIQTRSGTNRYSGSAVWSIRNSALDANTWTNNSTVDPQTGRWAPAPPNWYNNHEYTLSYGGPIVKNKTFFFVLWDQQINYQRDLVTTNVMTDTARQGIFRYFEGWNPGNVLTPTNAGGTNPIIASVDLAGNPVAPPTNPNGTPYTGGLRCFSVFGNVKFDGTPFTAADCPGGMALTNSGPWDSLRPVADPTGYIRKILDKMPPANYFGIGDGLNQAAYRWVRPRHENEGGIHTYAGADPFTDRKQINVKIDENFNPNYRLSVGWSSERNDSENFATPNWPGALSSVTKRYPQVITANFTSVLSANLFNEARFGLRRQKADVILPWESDRLREEAMRYTIAGNNGYFAVVNPGAGNYAFGGSLNGVMNTNLDQFYGGNENFLYTYADALSWTMRKHAFKVGAELRFARSKDYNNLPNGLSYPRVVGGAGGNTSTLASTIAGLPGLLGTSRTNVSNMQYFLAGSVDNATMRYWIDDPSDVTNGVWEDVRTKRRRYRDQRQEEWAVFWKDDWKFTHNLTLNIGLRYEYYGSPYISSGLASTPADQGDGLWGAFRGGGGNPFERWLSPGNVYLTGYGPNVAAADALKCAPPACDPNTLTTIEFVGPNSTNPGKRVIPADRNNFAPAVGFAWRLPWFGEGKTTVRGGYQITYGGSFGATGIPNAFGTHSFITSAPGSTSPAQLASYITEFSGQYLDLRSVPLLVPVRPTNPARPGRQLDISASSSSGDFHAYDARYATPYVQNFNLAITRTLRSNLSIDLRYIGTVSRKQAGQINLNTPNVYHNKELFEALEITRAGGNAPLFDQMFAGLNLNPNVAGYGPVGTSGQTGSAHLRRIAAVAPHLANGNFAAVANLLNFNGPGNSGLLSLPQGFTGTAGGRLLRNGCDRMAAGQTTVGPANSSPMRCFPENYIRANPQLLNSFLETNSASSNYHSMQAQIMLRPTRGAMLMGTYTWSKNLGVPGMILPGVGVAGPDYTDPSDRQGDYAFTYSHRAHDFRGSASFEVPVGPGRLLLGNSSGWLARFVEGWRTSFIFGFSSGVRADVSSSYLSTAIAYPTGLYGASVPDVVRGWPSVLNGQVRWDGDNPNGAFPGGSYFGDAGSFINVEDPQCAGVTTADNLRNFCTLGAVADRFSGEIVLQNPKPGTRGNLGQRRVTLPGIWNLDANIAKTIQISESGWIKSLQLRVDATNVLNHPVPLLPALYINSGSPFGLIAGKGDQVRSFQGQVRVQF